MSAAELFEMLQETVFWLMEHEQAWEDFKKAKPEIANIFEQEEPDYDE